jgi:hypothetical protein
MSTFEPLAVISILKNSGLVSPKQRKDFEVKWNKAVSVCFLEVVIDVQ